jgi:hypothetical protein
MVIHSEAWASISRDSQDMSHAQTASKSHWYSSLLKFDCNHHDIVVELTVAHDFVGQAPVVCVSHCLLKDLEVPAGTGGHVPEPG